MLSNKNTDILINIHRYLQILQRMVSESKVEHIEAKVVTSVDDPETKLRVIVDKFQESKPRT